MNADVYDVAKTAAERWGIALGLVALLGIQLHFSNEREQLLFGTVAARLEEEVVIARAQQEILSQHLAADLQRNVQLQQLIDVISQGCRGESAETRRAH